MKYLGFIILVLFSAALLNGAVSSFEPEIKDKLRDEFAGKYIGVVMQDNLPAMSVKGEFGNSAYGTCYIHIKNGGDWKHRRNLATFLKSLKGRQYCTNCFHKGDLVVVSRLKIKKNAIIIRIVSLDPKTVLRSNGEVSREVPEPHSTDMKFTFSSEDRNNYKVIRKHIRSYLQIFTNRAEAREFASKFSSPSGNLDMKADGDSSIRRVSWLKSY